METGLATSTNKFPALSDITFYIDPSRRKEKERRKLNLTVHKVPEFTSSNAQEREAYLDGVDTILQKT